MEVLQSNVERLDTFKAELVVFPTRVRKFLAQDGIVREKVSDEFVRVTNEMRAFKAYDKFRLERTNKRHLGARLKRVAEAEKEEKK